MLLEKGKVYLVGAGPGDPGLITVKGVQLLKEAEVVIYDRLVHPEILSEINPDAEKLYVGKKCDHHTVPQDDINELIVKKAKEGYRVVRLKGGDPFVFGRGAEEVLFLINHGVPWEVIPGVTSATAVPAYSGIPITHREYSSMVSIITGHETFSKDRTRLRYDLIAPNDSTLVILMGITNLQTIVEELIHHGRDASTPVCIINWGTYDRQKVLVGTLADIAEKNKKAGIKPPGIIIIGEVVKLREKFMPSEDDL